MRTLHWRSREAERFVAEARGVEIPPPRHPGPGDVERFLEVRDALPPALAAAVAAHLARGVAEGVLDPTRRWLAKRWAEPVRIERDETRTRRALAELWGGPEPARGEAVLAALRDRLRIDVERLTAAKARAARAAGELWARLGTERHPDAGPEPDARRASAQHVLSTSEDLRGAALEALGEPTTLVELTRALRWREGDRDAPTRDRYRRVGRTWAALEAELAQKVRVDASHAQPRVEPHVVILTSSKDVRILPSPVELGWQSERAAAAAVGRALALVLSAPPVAFARPTAQTLARAFGELGAQIWADAHRARGDGLSSVDAARRARMHAARSVLELRLHAASVEMGFVVPRTGGWDDRGEDLDSVAESLVAQALGVSVPASIARLWIHTPSGGGARLRAALGGLRLWVGLREHFDRDWYRNPRAEETLRELAAPGGGSCIEDACAPLAGEDAWRARLEELLT